MLVMPGTRPGTGKIIAHGLQSPESLFGLQTEGTRKRVSARKIRDMAICVLVVQGVLDGVWGTWSRSTIN